MSTKDPMTMLLESRRAERYLQNPVSDKKVKDNSLKTLATENGFRQNFNTSRRHQEMEVDSLRMITNSGCPTRDLGAHFQRAYRLLVGVVST